MRQTSVGDSTCAILIGRFSQVRAPSRTAELVLEDLCNLRRLSWYARYVVSYRTKIRTPIMYDELGSRPRVELKVPGDWRWI